MFEALREARLTGPISWVAPLPIARSQSHDTANGLGPLCSLEAEGPHHARWRYQGIGPSLDGRCSNAMVPTMGGDKRPIGDPGRWTWCWLEKLPLWASGPQDRRRRRLHDRSWYRRWDFWGAAAAASHRARPPGPRRWKQGLQAPGIAVRGRAPTPSA